MQLNFTLEQAVQLLYLRKVREEYLYPKAVEVSTPTPKETKVVGRGINLQR